MDQSLSTSVLLIDGNKLHRAYWADQLKSCSRNYQILEADDGRSGLDIYRSRQVDCVIVELRLSDQSIFRILGKLVPVSSRPHVAVIVLTELPDRGVRELAKRCGAYECFHKHHTTGDDLDKAIHAALAFVRQMPKKDRHSVPSSYTPHHPGT